ncbi:hypothetical protein HRI_004079100 [Hibiscus trionum]|uniref:CCHC-type domain-containing protein n=1 Tax=Hibiscus trionum TaxID=183268 RepID=A0A9W7IZF7_HIBTR|nr:hypothetical protein HRI_004079100 [Hibiscus trionum]
MPGNNGNPTAPDNPNGTGLDGADGRPPDPTSDDGLAKPVDAEKDRKGMQQEAAGKDSEMAAAPVDTSNPGNIDANMSDDINPISPSSALGGDLGQVPRQPTMPVSGNPDGAGSEGRKPSFRDIMIGQTTETKDTCAIDDLDMVVLDDDVRVQADGAIPEITFSERVHAAIDKRLENSVIVRLLGKSIGYTALLTRIEALWKPKGGMRLIDLDNEYYLVRFAKAEDCEKVLTGGPWVIYGAYLTVQPWSRNFSTANYYPSKIMVWIRIPGLPYRYYTKSLFSHIASSLGIVVRIDYNTSEGCRGKFARLALMVDLEKPLKSGVIVDGKRQVVEYEGLPAICFACGKYGHTKENCGLLVTDMAAQAPQEPVPSEKEIYGPWMQVTSRRRKLPPAKRDAGPSSKSSVVAGNVQGSRFASLGVVDDYSRDVVPVNGNESNMHDKPVNVSLVRAGQVGNGHVGSSKQGARSNVRKTKVVEVAVAKDQTPPAAVAQPADVRGMRGKDVAVASKENVLPVPSTLDNRNHGVVHVIDSSARQVLRERNGRVLPASILSSAMKGNEKNKVAIPGVARAKLKKKANKQTIQSALQELVTSLSSELDHAQGVFDSSKIMVAVGFLARSNRSPKSSRRVVVAWWLNWLKPK